MLSNVKLNFDMNQEELPEFLTISQASKILSCHPNTLRNWEKRGDIECVRFGRRGDRRFRKKVILRLVDSL